MDDLISRQAVLEATSTTLKITGKENAETVYEYIKRLCDDIKALPSARQWIPCSERLPEKNCRCLTTNEAWGSFEVDWNAWIDGRWLYPNDKPIAWMPLPEPYREEVSD